MTLGQGCRNPGIGWSFPVVWRGGGGGEEREDEDCGGEDYGVEDCGVEDYKVEDYGVEDYGVEDCGVEDCVRWRLRARGTNNVTRAASTRLQDRASIYIHRKTNLLASSSVGLMH